MDIGADKEKLKNMMSAAEEWLYNDGFDSTKQQYSKSTPHTLTYIHTYTYTCIHTHIRTYTYIHMHTHTHTIINIHAHTHIYTHTHTHMYSPTSDNVLLVCFYVPAHHHCSALFYPTHVQVIEIYSQSLSRRILSVFLLLSSHLLPFLPYCHYSFLSHSLPPFLTLSFPLILTLLIDSPHFLSFSHSYTLD